MRLTSITTLILFLSLTASSLYGQSEKKTYSFKKGQVFDIIFLSNKPDVEAKLQNYFKRAFPIANENGYHGLGGYALKESPTQGNYHPQTMVFGYWDNLPRRLNFLETVTDKMPDFHEMRRDIWSTFALTYWELKEDLSFEVDPDKFNVVTAYWKKDGQSLAAFKKEWANKSGKAGGKTVVTFTEGTSPFGYHYAPDYLVITSWDSKERFDRFYKDNLKMDHSSIKHVNQLVF